jgi:hypothetical protein
MTVLVSWIVTPFSEVIRPCFLHLIHHHEDGGGMVHRNVSILRYQYTVLQPRRHRFESSSPWKPEISYHTWINFMYLTEKLQDLRLSRWWRFEVFWVATPYTVVIGYQRFGGTYCLHPHPEERGTVDLRNIGILPQHCTESQPLQLDLNKFLQPEYYIRNSIQLSR